MIKRTALFAVAIIFAMTTIAAAAKNTSGHIDSGLFVMATDPHGRTGCIASAWLTKI